MLEKWFPLRKGTIYRPPSDQTHQWTALPQSRLFKRSARKFGGHPGPLKRSIVSQFNGVPDRNVNPGTWNWDSQVRRGRDEEQGTAWWPFAWPATASPAPEWRAAAGLFPLRLRLCNSEFRQPAACCAHGVLLSKRMIGSGSIMATLASEASEAGEAVEPPTPQRVQQKGCGDDYPNSCPNPREKHVWCFLRSLFL